jgi:hemoglobin
VTPHRPALRQVGGGLISGKHDNVLVSGPEQSPYERLGGSPFFTRLVTAFYAGVEGDPLLRPLYPGSDLGPAAERLRLFLEQYWGGPTTYSERRGHPRLRMHHRPFAVDEDAREHWLTHMRAALDEQALEPDLDVLLWGYFESTAGAMMNTPKHP